MLGKAIGVAALSIFLLAPPLAAKQEGPTGFARIHGRVMEDGRPIRRIVEIRLVSMTSGIVDRAYTFAGDEFEFRSAPVDPADEYVLVIDELGYSEVRQEIQIGRDPFGAGAYVAGGLVMLYLESLPPEAARTDAGETVDLGQLTAETPDEAREAYERALRALDDGNPVAALEQLERAVDVAPQFYEALHRLGVEYLRAERFRDAETMLDRAYELNQNDPLLLTNLGTVHFQEAQTLEQAAVDSADLERAMMSYVQAAEYLDDAMRLDPGSARVAYYLGSALYKTRAYDLAEEALFVSMDNDPGWIDARLTLINVYVRQQRHEAALEQIALYLEENPDTPERESMEKAREGIEAALAR